MRFFGNKFFRNLWRFNAVAIALTYAAFSIAGLFAVYFVILESNYGHNGSDVVNFSQNDQVVDRYVFGQGRALQGKEFLFVPINRLQSYKGELKEKNYGNSIVNYLVIDQVRNKSKWLASGSGQLYLAFEEVYDNLTPGDLDTEIARHIVYRVVTKDTNGDKLFSDADKISLYSSSFDGSNYRLLLSDVDEVYSMAQTLSGDFMIFYRKNDEYYTEHYELDSLKLVSRSKVSEFKK
ncbi:MAG: hypothetical protein ACK41P_06210 [Asticcacaulis sp.]